MISFLGKWGTLWPVGLVFLPVILGLMLYLYLKRKSGQALPVATLFLLRNLKNCGAARRKINLPWSFFVELLLLLLLLLGGVGLYHQEARISHGFILDNSLSMSLTDSADPLGQTLLDIAKRDMVIYLDQLPGNAMVELFVCAPRFLPLSNGPITAKEASALVPAVKAVSAPDNLERLLQTLGARTNLSRITVFSDKTVNGENAQRNSRIEIVTIQPGNGRSGVQNIAVSDVSLMVDSEARADSSVKAEVLSFAKLPLEFPLVLYGWRQEQLELGAQLIEKRLVTLSPGSRQVVKFTVENGGWDAFKVVIEPELGSVSGLADGIKLDSSAWLSAGSKFAELIIVSTLSRKELGLDKLSRFKVNVMTLEQYSAKASSIGSDSIIIFHRAVPNLTPRRNFMMILPQASSQWASAFQHPVSGPVASWNESHPIMSYLNVPLLTLKSSSTLTGEPGSEELIRTTDGVVALAHRESDLSYVVFGFELFPFDGMDSPFLSILTLNAIKWLQESRPLMNYQRGAEQSDIAASYVKIDTLSEQQLATAGEAILPGLYLREKKGMESELVAVNFFSREESNVAAQGAISLPLMSVEEASNSSREGRKFYYLILAGIALLALTVDLLCK